jgi:hypothetical protein
MDIEKRIKDLDEHLYLMKLYANSYYNVLPSSIPTYVGIDGEQINDIKVLIDERLRYKKEKGNLLKKLERKQKIEKINENFQKTL